MARPLPSPNAPLPGLRCRRDCGAVIRGGTWRTCDIDLISAEYATHLVLLHGLPDAQAEVEAADLVPAWAAAIRSTRVVGFLAGQPERATRPQRVTEVARVSLGLLTVVLVVLLLAVGGAALAVSGHLAFGGGVAAALSAGVLVLVAAVAAAHRYATIDVL